MSLRGHPVGRMSVVSRALHLIVTLSQTHKMVVPGGLQSRRGLPCTLAGVVPHGPCVSRGLQKNVVHGPKSEQLCHIPRRENAP